MRGTNRAELLLAALNDLAENLDHGSETGAVSSPPYQVVVYTWKLRGAAEARIGRGCAMRRQHPGPRPSQPLGPETPDVAPFDLYPEDRIVQMLVSP